jgi:hypothetical protein
MAVIKAVESHQQNHTCDNESFSACKFSDDNFLLRIGALHHVCNGLDVFHSIKTLEEPC